MRGDRHKQKENRRKHSSWSMVPKVSFPRGMEGGHRQGWARGEVGFIHNFKKGVMGLVPFTFYEKLVFHG